MGGQDGGARVQCGVRGGARLFMRICVRGGVGVYKITMVFLGYI